MKQPVQVQFHGMAPSPAVEAAAREKAARLERFAPDLMACRVVIDQTQKHQHQGRPFAVRIDLTLPDHELVVDRVQDEDAYVALRDAFDAMTRRLEDVVRRRQGQEKLHVQPLHGEVLRLDPEGRFGFIGGSDGEEYYFARENLVDTPFEHVDVGTPVQFLPEAAGEGWQAKRVSVRRAR